ncbi:TauD/TfdA dioxygenase family protein [Streptomyces sp. BP-8]|uniref:TauD/TfdA family dioxygenase n=1 Tax=Streptomyces sirii TaxID=3127701 RepID=A0ABZ2QEB2_9ACTN
MDVPVDDLIAHATRDELVYRHHWLPGDIVIWDNRRVMHRATPFSAMAPRVMHRITVAHKV